ncbi:MAG: hypothetical protein IK024_13515 [Treponema sp.]|nr:hypothetical protein [Treponema sp.]
MDLQKRECPMEITTECGAGWGFMKIQYENLNLEFYNTNVYDRDFDDLLKTLYFLNPYFEDDLWPNDLDKYPDKPMFEVVEYQKKNDIGFRYHAISSNFIWNEEPDISKWTISRKATSPKEHAKNYSFDLIFHIEKYEESIDNKTEFDFQIKYNDFCYAVAKAFTQLIKKHGFYGYHQSTYNQDFNMRYFLSIKAIALNNFEALKIEDVKNEHVDGDSSSFEKELELLQFDM